jgi:hypothetical protein
VTSTNLGTFVFQNLRKKRTAEERAAAADVELDDRVECLQEKGVKLFE